VTGAGGLNTTAPVTYANNVNAGTATAQSTYPGDANHADSTGSTNFTIAPASPTAVATGGTFTFDGQPHPGTCTVSDGLPGALTYNPGGASAPVAVGDYTVNCNYASDGNHNAAHDSALIHIVPSPANINSASPANGKPNDGFMVLRGNNLPTDIAVVQSAAGSANGFIYQSPSTPNAVWVRLPGAPSGPATIMLKNAAGTVASNSFAISITPDPGTPVITGIFNNAGQPITAPVPAGTTILVGADGIDTTGAVVRFTQGTNTWDVPASGSASNSAIGVTAVVVVPAGAGGGTIGVSIRQTSSLPSAPVNLDVAAPAPTFMGSAGGGGGTPFGPIMCPGGSVATALHGRAGDDIDRTELWCSPAVPGVSTGAASLAGAVGGFGGNDYGAALTCPANYAMTGIHGLAGTVVWGGNVVDTLGVTCTHVVTGAVYQSGTVGNATPANPFSINCNPGQEVVGIAGGQGGLLDRIGIYCSNVAAPEPSADAAIDLLSGEARFGASDERANLIEEVIGRAIVEENRRRFAAPR
jgi:hypothetical protein